MYNAKYVRKLIEICVLAIVMVPYTTSIAQNSSTVHSAYSATIEEALTLLDDSSQFITNEQPFDTSATLIGVGFGYANAIVVPNTDNKFNDGRKLHLGLGLSTEYALAPYFALTARADIFIAFGYSLFAGPDASLSAAATAGFTIGKIRQPEQIYLTATAGPGFAVIGDRGLDEDGDQDCLLCTTKEGGSSAGLATRLAIGRIGKLGQRIELVYMRNGGNGNNRNYTNDEEAFIETVLIQFSTRSNTQ